MKSHMYGNNAGLHASRDTDFDSRACAQPFLVSRHSFSQSISCPVYTRMFITVFPRSRLVLTQYESSPQLSILFLHGPPLYYPPIYASVFRVVSSFRVFQQNSYSFFIYPMHGTRSFHLILLDLIIFISWPICKLWKSYAASLSLLSLHSSLVRSSFLGILFPNTLSICVLGVMRDTKFDTQTQKNLYFCMFHSLHS
jgi:hypothetical protein